MILILYKYKPKLELVLRLWFSLGLIDLLPVLLADLILLFHIILCMSCTKTFGMSFSTIDISGIRMSKPFFLKFSTGYLSTIKAWVSPLLFWIYCKPFQSSMSDWNAIYKTVLSLSVKHMATENDVCLGRYVCSWGYFEPPPTFK